MAIWFGDPGIVLPLRPGPGVMAHVLGIEVTELGEDWARGRMPVDGRTRQPAGLLHGGASVALAETLMSFAATLCVDRARFAIVGQQISANHLRGVREGWVTATARPVHLGRTSQVWDCAIDNEAGERVCVSRMTAAVVARP